MKITVILTPSASPDVRMLEKQSLESITEALKLKQNGRAHVVTVIAIGQPLSDSQCSRLQHQGVDYTLFRDSDPVPGPMELAELCVDIVNSEAPDLLFIGRGEDDRQCQLGNLLTELLEFRVSPSDQRLNQHYRTLVIREIGNGMHTVRVSLITPEKAETGSDTAISYARFNLNQLCSV